MAPERLWTGILLLLPLVSVAAEKAGVTPTEPAIASTQSPTPTLAQNFDLRGDAVRAVVRATAATQASSGYRVDPVSHKPDLAEILQQDPPPPRIVQTPRLPARTECQGFLECALETVLGLEDDTEQLQREERHRLMNQGSFTDDSACEACDSRPRVAPQVDTGPIH